MALLKVAQDVADEVGLPRPAAVATGADQLARQMFALANATLEELGEMAWPVLEQSYDFNTVVGQDSYDLPDGFVRLIADTVYNTSQYRQLRGSLSAAQWQERRKGMPDYVGFYRFRLYGYPLKIVLSPTPQVIDSLTYDYVSSLLVAGEDSVLKPLYTADSDEAIVPERLVRMGLKWRIKHAKGLDFSEDFNKYEDTRKLLLAQQLALGTQPIAQLTYADVPELGEGYVPDTGFGI